MSTVGEEKKNFNIKNNVQSRMNKADYLAQLMKYDHFTLKMEAARSSKMLVSYHNTKWHHNAKDHDLTLFVQMSTTAYVNTM
jgi:hypothetical protein